MATCSKAAWQERSPVSVWDHHHAMCAQEGEWDLAGWVRDVVGPNRTWGPQGGGTADGMCRTSRGEGQPGMEGAGGDRGSR